MLKTKKIVLGRKLSLNTIRFKPKIDIFLHNITNQVIIKCYLVSNGHANDLCEEASSKSGVYQSFLTHGTLQQAFTNKFAREMHHVLVLHLTILRW